MIASLLRDGQTRHTLRNANVALFAPSRLLHEVETYLPAVAFRIGSRAADVRLLVNVLLGRVRIVPDHVLAPFYDQAFAALGRVDVSDVPFLACALAVRAEGIWSRDRHFDEQELVPRFEPLPG